MDEPKNLKFYFNGFEGAFALPRREDRVPGQDINLRDQFRQLNDIPRKGPNKICTALFLSLTVISDIIFEFFLMC